MKLFISADMEGVAGVADWEETEPGKRLYEHFAQEMTNEVRAACEGALEAGVSDILVKDAHDSGRNIDPSALPDQARMVRSWAGNPLCMMAGIDTAPFDAALMIGYHSAHGTNGNPMAHTMNCQNNYVKMNGELVSEFMMNACTAAYFGIPVIFVSGDRMLCESAKKLVPGIRTAVVSEGYGNASIAVGPAVAARNIKEEVRASFGNLSACRLTLPDRFEVEVCFREHFRAFRSSFYPGARQIDAVRVGFTAGDYMDVLKFFMFVL